MAEEMLALLKSIEAKMDKQDLNINNINSKMEKLESVDSNVNKIINIDLPIMKRSINQYYKEKYRHHNCFIISLVSLNYLLN